MESSPSLEGSVPLLARLARPYIWNELPGWGKVYNAFCRPNEHSHRWPKLSARGKWHGKLMQLDLSDWAERYTYFLGRYYDLPTQIFLRKYLKQGDHFVDIGANIGMISLLASHLVGESGTVRSFEPNPYCCDRMEWLIKTNDLRNLTLSRAAVADAAGQLELSVPKHSGMGTLAAIPPDRVDAYSTHFKVDVKRGDDALAGDVPIHILKVDVEGYECKVLAGCAAAINRWRPSIITEVVPEHLQRAGSSPQMLFELMSNYGYQGFGLTTRRRFGRHDLALEKLDDQTHAQYEDVVFLHAGNSSTANIISSCISSSHLARP
jgi:FkbM family methyltransferase